SNSSALSESAPSTIDTPPKSPPPAPARATRDFARSCMVSTLWLPTCAVGTTRFPFLAGALALTTGVVFFRDFFADIVAFAAGFFFAASLDLGATVFRALAFAFFLLVFVFFMPAVYHHSRWEDAWKVANGLGCDLLGEDPLLMALYPGRRIPLPRD